MSRITSILEKVREERERQEKLWGQQNHNPAIWLMILGEEVGEANQAYCEAYFAKGKGIIHNELRHLRTELIQVAAVAVAIVESLDRNEIAEIEREIDYK